MDNPVEAVVWYVAFLFSTSFHEAAHAWVAKRGGDLTAYFGGQVTLDPRPHIRRSPIGMVVLPIISLIVIQWPFGFASAPYDPAWADRHPRRAAWMSLAGPGANLLLVLVATGLIWAGVLAGTLTNPQSLRFESVVVAAQPGIWESLALIVSIFFSLNLILFVLNLLPLPPLDGSGALPLILPAATARKIQSMMRQPMMGWIGIIVAWNLFGKIFWPIFKGVVQMMYGVTYG